MPRTKTLKISSDEQDWLLAIDALGADVEVNLSGTQASYHNMDWDERTKVNKMFIDIKTHCQKGGDFSIGWDAFFDKLFPTGGISVLTGRLGASWNDFMDYRCNICYAYARKQGRLKLNQEKIYLESSTAGWRSANHVYKYARYVVRGRLHSDVEAVVDFSRCYKYPEWLNKMDLAYEDILMKNTTAAYQFYCSNYYLPDNVHNMMIASKLGGDNHAAAYFKEKEKVETYLLTALNNVDKTMTVGDFVKKIMK